MTDLPDRADFGDYAKWPGRAVLDPSGRRLGDVREIYLDDATDRPEWVLVELEGEGPRFVPLVDASVDGEAIRVAQASDRVEAAPTLEPSKELSQDEERRLYSHYGLDYSEDESDSLLPAPEQGSGDETAAEAPPAGGADAAAPATPAAGATGSPSNGSPPSGDGDGDAGRPRLRRYVGAGPELPAAGETSEPADQGEMVPPRPEPVAPSPPPPPQVPRAEGSSTSGGPKAATRKVPVPLAAGLAASLVALIVIVLRRRG